MAKKIGTTIVGLTVVTVAYFGGKWRQRAADRKAATPEAPQ